MTDSVQGSDPSSAKARLKRLLEDMYALVEEGSQDEQQTILSFFEDTRIQGFLEDRRREKQEGLAQEDSAVITGAMGERVLKDFIGDIGTGGMFIETPESFSVGESITLILAPTHEEGPVKITGKIVWQNPKGVGVKFTSAISDLEEILKFI
jgi:hypothetical protein